MGEAFIFKVAAHAAIEGTGALSLACALALCSHEHHQRGLRGTLAAMRFYRPAVLALIYSATSVATVVALDRDVFTEGAAALAATLSLHLALEAAGAGIWPALARRIAAWPRPAAAAALVGVYLALAAASVALIPFGH